MNPLLSRKQLLLAESNLNRAHLVEQWQTLRAELHGLTKQAGTIGAWAAVAASATVAWTSFRNRKSAPPATKPSWLKAMLKGAGLAATVWSACRAPGRDRAET
jgi:hypothetical protein